MTNEGSGAILRGHCPNCGTDRNAEVLAEDTQQEEYDEGTFYASWYMGTYSILRCLRCDRRYIRLAEACSEYCEEDYDPDTGSPASGYRSELPTGRLSPPPEQRGSALSGSSLTL